MKKYHLQGRMKIKWFCKQFDKSIIFLQRGLMMAMVHPRDNAQVTHANKILNKIFPLRLLLRMTKISLKSCQHKSSDFLLSNRRTRLYTRVYCLSAFNELRLLRVSLFYIHLLIFQTYITLTFVIEEEFHLRCYFCQTQWRCVVCMS